MDAQTAITDTDRAAHARRTVGRWVETLESNADHAAHNGNTAEARDLRFRASELRDVLAMLDGTEDDHIAQLHA